MITAAPSAGQRQSAAGRGAARPSRRRWLRCAAVLVPTSPGPAARPLRPSPPSARGAAGGLGPRRVGVHEPGAAGGEPAVQEPDLLGGRAAQWTRRGQHDLRARAQRVDHRHRRHAARGDPGRGEPAVAHHRDLPAAAPVGPRSDQLVDGGERGQPLRRGPGPAPARRAGRGGGPRSRTARGRRGRRCAGAEPSQGRVVAAAEQVGARRRPRARTRPGSAARRTARRSAPARAARTGSPARRAPGCAGCRRASARRRARSRRRRPPPAATGTGPAAPSLGVATTDSRGNASAVGVTHQAWCGRAGAAVVARPVGGDQPQLAHRRLQRVRAHDRVDPLGERHHVAHPTPPLAGGEVAAHAAPQVAARADVEHLVARRRGTGTPPARTAPPRPACACAAAPWWAGAAPRRWRAPAAPGGSARRRCRPAPAAGAAPRRWPGHRRARGGWAWWRCRRAGPARRAARWAPRRGTARPARAAPCTAPAAAARPARAARRRRAGTRRRTGRCAPPAPRLRGTPGATAAPRRARGAPVTIAVVMPVRATMLGGTPVPGSTSVASSPIRSPPRTLTAPISVIASPCAEPPVVSRSSTTNVTSRSGVPSSSNDSCVEAEAGTQRQASRAPDKNRAAPGGPAPEHRDTTNGPGRLP